MEFVSKNLTLRQVNALVKVLGGEGVVHNILAGTVKFTVTEKTITTEVFSVKLGGATTTDQIVELWRKAGFYANEHITQANLPLNPHDEEEVEIEIIDPGCSFSEAEGLDFLKAAGLRRPTYEHALRFAEQCGETMAGAKKPYIIFLHESWLGPRRSRRVVDVRRGPDDRELRLYCPDYRFNDDCVLAGMRPRKQSLEV